VPVCSSLDHGAIIIAPWSRASVEPFKLAGAGVDSITVITAVMLSNVSEFRYAQLSVAVR